MLSGETIRDSRSCEAVILSGPRKGEIIQLSDDLALTPEEERSLDEFLIRARERSELLSEARAAATSVRADVRALESEVWQLRDRVTRLETQRVADRAEWDARFAKFTAEVRAALAGLEIRLPGTRSEK